MIQYGTAAQKQRALNYMKSIAFSQDKQNAADKA